jgi:hypothetical protein
MREIEGLDTHRLGNLCLLTDEENQKLKNHPFAAKLEIVNGWQAENIFITSKLSRKVFDEYKSRDSVQLGARESELVDNALTVFRADSGAL